MRGGRMAIREFFGVALALCVWLARSEHTSAQVVLPSTFAESGILCLGHDSPRQPRYDRDGGRDGWVGRQPHRIGR